MATFDNVKGILNFGVPRRTEGIEYIMWPVFAYRLTAPVLPVQHKSNPLERALLGLVRAGIIEPIELAGFLGIAPELAEHIIRRLKGGYQPALDARMQLTNEGRSVLDDEDAEASKEATGWIFQDPWSGELWDRFVKDLPTVPVTGERRVGGGFATEIDLGTEGKPFLYTPWVIEPKTIVHIQPQAADILRSVRLLDNKGNKHEHDDDVDNRELRQADVSKVTYLDALPETMYCVTALKADLNSDNRDAWKIGDIFQPRKESMRLRRALTLQLPAYPFIADRLAKLLGLQHVDQGISLAEFFKGADAVAELEIEGRFGVLADKFNMKDRLVELAKKWQVMRSVGEAADPEPVLLACGKVAERLMKQVLASAPVERRKLLANHLNLKRGNKCDKLLGQDTAGSITSLGYLKVPKSLLSLDQGKLNHALIKGTESLMPLTLAALLCAVVADRHPLRALALSNPDLLSDIAAISEGRNPVAHDGDVSAQASQIILYANGLAERTFSLTQLVLNELNAVIV